ncbi:MAG TPA: response regulator transcription factor [Anaerolineales bacterium]|nr:response regulator transcription factor [Anaerolineales bacterium]
MDTIRLLIADDQTITRSGLRTLLASQEAIEVVGEARNGEEAIELAVSLQPDLILMDLRMPGINGIEATRRIHRTSPHIGILVLTVFEDDTSVFPAIRAGARGYLLKNTEQDELLRAIRTVANGGAIFSPGIAGRVLGYLNPPAPNVPKHAFDELTNREREILELIARGKTNSEIAEALSLSPKTVSNNISNVLVKVQATDRAKLMLMALEAGMGSSVTKP